MRGLLTAPRRIRRRGHRRGAPAYRGCGDRGREASVSSSTARTVARQGTKGHEALLGSLRSSRIFDAFVTIGLTMKRRASYALAVLFAINAMNFFDRQIIGAVAEPIRREWALSDTELGVLATVFTLVVRRGRVSRLGGCRIGRRERLFWPAACSCGA